MCGAGTMAVTVVGVLVVLVVVVGVVVCIVVQRVVLLLRVVVLGCACAWVCFACRGVRADVVVEVLLLLHALGVVCRGAGVVVRVLVPLGVRVLGCVCRGVCVGVTVVQLLLVGVVAIECLGVRVCVCVVRGMRRVVRMPLWVVLGDGCCGVRVGDVGGTAPSGAQGRLYGVSCSWQCVGSTDPPRGCDRKRRSWRSRACVDVTSLEVRLQWRSCGCAGGIAS